MRIFISWSGDRSHTIAESLKKFIRRVIQRADPWLSSVDIAKGTRWGSELAGELATTGFGIICVTRENLKSPWIHFEAGALSKKNNSRVIPYLIDSNIDDLPDTLKQFNFALSSKEETFKLLESINESFEKDKLSHDDLHEAFEKWWPDLESAITSLPPSDQPEPPPLSPEDLLAKMDRKLSELSEGFKIIFNRLERSNSVDIAQREAEVLNHIMGFVSEIKSATRKSILDICTGAGYGLHESKVAFRRLLNIGILEEDNEDGMYTLRK